VGFAAAGHKLVSELQLGCKIIVFARALQSYHIASAFSLSLQCSRIQLQLLAFGFFQNFCLFFGWLSFLVGFQFFTGMCVMG